MSIKPATDAETAALALAERNGWPEELRTFLDRYPREVWAGHENLGQMCQFWLSRHNMFRELAAAIEDALTRYRDGKVGAEEFVNFFAPRLQFFLQQLHAHHQIEDFHYFPIFRKAEPRLLAGFDVLEADHVTLHHDIDFDGVRRERIAAELFRRCGHAQTCCRRLCRRVGRVVQGPEAAS